MRYILVGLLLYFVLSVSSSENSAVRAGYRVIPFETGAKEMIEDGLGWKTCGNYFAARESALGKLVHFAFEQGPPAVPPTSYIVVEITRVAVAESDRMTTPRVEVRGNRWFPTYFLVMSKKDRDISRPCFVNGTDV